MLNNIESGCMMESMARRLVTLLTIGALFSAITLPAQVLAKCPILHPQAKAHPCCRHLKSESVPIAKCLVSCNVAGGEQALGQIPPKQPRFATLNAFVSDDAKLAMPGSHEVTSAPAFFDSSGLYLRVRVLRI
jgi:hypothetical protein